MGGGFLTLDNGKSGIDVADVLAVSDAVEMEEQGIEFGAEVETAILVPLEGWAFIAEVAGKGSHVVGGVGEFKDSIADNFGGGFGDQSGWTRSGWAGLQEVVRQQIDSGFDLGFSGGRQNRKWSH